MLEKKYKHALIRFEGRKGMITYYTMLFFPFFFLMMGILNLHLASDIGISEGYGLPDLIRAWIAGPDADRQYSGIFLMALERTETAFFDFGFFIIGCLIAADLRNTRKRNKRIAEILKYHNEWPE